MLLPTARRNTIGTNLLVEALKLLCPPGFIHKDMVQIIAIFFAKGIIKLATSPLQNQWTHFEAYVEFASFLDGMPNMRWINRLALHGQ